jgi:hypothetical protein
MNLISGGHVIVNKDLRQNLYQCASRAKLVWSCSENEPLWRNRDLHWASKVDQESNRRW